MHLSQESLSPRPDWDTVIHATHHDTVDSLIFSIEEDDEDALKRIGCYMIMAMPQEGLDEALSLLKDILKFHQESYLYSLPEPPVAYRRKAGAVKKSTRPDLVISE